MKSGDPYVDHLVDTYDALHRLEREHETTCRAAQAISGLRFALDVAGRKIICFGCGQARTA